MKDWNAGFWLEKLGSRVEKGESELSPEEE